MSVYAWHFTAGNKLRDGSPLPPLGETLKFNGEPIICVQGLHSSLHPFDALKYAPGDTLHFVHCAGIILHQNDKLVCTERTIIASLEASEMLRYFARMQALSVLHLVPKNMARLVEDWLMNGDEAIRSAAYYAADSAAYSAARSAAYSAARSAAYSAAYSAADSAAYSAARSAARSAANSAANSAARSAANSAANSAADYAAYYAAYYAADSAADSAARQSFADLVYECFEGPMENVGFAGHP